MKNIFVIAPKDDFDLIQRILSTKKIDFIIWSFEDYKKQKEIKIEIKNNDINLLGKANFNAQLFQSVNEDIPTRLLVPKNFSSFETWNKEYTLLHELGHYFSINRILIGKYYSLLEEKRLNGQLYNIPLEIEAEKYVFRENKKLFKKNADTIYLNYYRQIKENMKNIRENTIEIKENFEQIIEIRLFRYCAIINKILNKGTKIYKRHADNIEKIKNILAKNGSKLKIIVNNMNDLNQKINLFYSNKDFDSYIKFCKKNYEIFNIKK